MRKDESGVSEWCKHTRKGLKRYVNKAVRRNVRLKLRKEQEKEGTNG